MLYIVIALKSEAQAFVDKYKPTKAKCGDFTLFEGNRLKLIVSGIGIDNARNATVAMIEHFKPQKRDIFINIGICGANKKHKIGKLLKIGSIIYEDKKYIIDEDILNTLTCKESEVSQDLYEIADMESFGFFTATKEFKNRYIYKVVSDHFEPSKVTKEGSKKLIFSVIDEIMREVEA
ncbi:MAG: hypothetical protein PHO62_04970 [Sulfurimonas sp.]|uniref:hypothetical protein n=1 Tax=Sulfurimonas sp. TaxID=2022749 RepID=UPI00262B93A6|nr:hypothetical protein [Sulfurimonas sp.]MDD5372758.1 hypothetical protein [Sulfurimonas sp.]